MFLLIVLIAFMYSPHENTNMEHNLSILSMMETAVEMAILMIVFS